MNAKPAPALEDVMFPANEAAEIAGTDGRWLYNQKYRYFSSESAKKNYDLRNIFRVAIAARLNLRGVGGTGLWQALWDASPLESAWRREPYRVVLRPGSGLILSDWMRNADEEPASITIPVNALHDHLVREVHKRLVVSLGQDFADQSFQDYVDRLVQLRQRLGVQDRAPFDDISI